ncbi:hypothetical protein TTHERM_00922980 (macronuclear) [Tetrahymena thermophila SB210]|uniref:Uncharacterized protein n=1 Tax=Tetrahymena thermophila (strain SB210) TaxID=312017 RepID=Q23WP7_TETTS|nr:hypothetical protein TTHERM_00922980 [Tetrahymena thermophila SB210]EAS00933.2 hypothetical protein TTHERM_00922980 [Tetrahymena thermophila SB210]|eukprot:XP_001021178.2 hypothetical protein TTHERM_00922980 [Tetrahymena thermophila SB210]
MLKLFLIQQEILLIKKLFHIFKVNFTLKQTDSIPRSLQLEFKKHKDTFLTEISYNGETNNFSNSSQFFNQNNYSTRNISTAASGSFRQKILNTRKPIDFAIKTYQNASLRLEKLFKSSIFKSDQKDKDDDLSDLENFKIKQTPKEQKRNVEHGILRKGTIKRSETSQNIAVTLQHIPILLESLDQQEKQESLPEEVKLLSDQNRLRNIVKKIDYSKQMNVLAPILQSKVYESRKLDNQLNFVLKKSSSKLHNLKMQENRIKNPLIAQEVADLKNQIADLQKTIDEFENKIEDQETYLQSKHYMKQVRYKDMMLKREENINLLKMNTHLSRYLSKETEQLVVDSKQLDNLFNKIVEEHRNNQFELKRQSIMTRDMENKKYNEDQVERLIDLESKMREYEKKEQQNIKREEYLEKKRIQNCEIDQIIDQQKEFGSMINQLEGQFLEFHQQNKSKVATSYGDLLSFCVHVKQSTENLKYEKEIFQNNLDKLKSEVNELEKELKELKLQNKFDFEIEEDKQQTFSKKQDIVNETDIFYTKSLKKNDEVYQIDNLELDNFEIQKIQNMNKIKEQMSEHNIFKCINGLKDLHQNFFTKLNHIQFDDLIKLKKKQFSAQNLEHSIKSFCISISSLINIIEQKKKGDQKKEDSLDIEEISDRLETSTNQPNQKYYYTYVDL